MRNSSQIGKLYINGYDAYTKWGIIVTPTTLSELMTPPSNKELVSNTSRLENGKRVILNNPRVADRDITLTLQMVAPDEQTFLANYHSFCEVLSQGRVELRTTYQSYTENGATKHTYYRLDYISCNQFQEFRMGIAKFSFKFNEPDPTDRALTSKHIV